MSERDRLRELDRTAVWHAFSQMSEYDGLIIDRAEGCWLTDIEGRRIFDGASSLWCNLFGHRVPEIDRAIIEQLGQVAHVTNLGMSHPTTIRLAERLLSHAVRGLKHVFFAGDGASAVEVAMKMAFQYWQQKRKPESGRTKFLALGDAYHGDTLGTVSVGGVSLFQKRFEPLLFEVLRGPCPDNYRRPAGMDESEACAHYLDAYRRLLDRHHREVVAVIAESCIQGAAGFVMQPKGFLAGLHRLCKDFGALLILDEIAVGMGRSGKMFAFEHEEVKHEESDVRIEPDFLCLGKGLTGGYLAMSATLTSERIWESFLGGFEDRKTFYHGHTFGGNPLAAAAGNAVLDLLEREDCLGRIQEKGTGLAGVLGCLANHPHVGEVRQLGMLAAVEIVEGKSSRTRFDWRKRAGKKFCDWMLGRGVWLRPLGDVVPVLPPLGISTEEFDFLEEIFSDFPAEFLE